KRALSNGSPFPAVSSTLLPLALCILTLLPHCLLGNPTEEESKGSSALLRRVKRGWVWNQFFVLEEYTGLEPLYIGKVSVDFRLYYSVFSVCKAMGMLDFSGLGYQLPA
uniref:Cadherin N-terminal domain-containing protein n=1 Tax=Labrus bergylta TaxID=56723 RepID=A0A3Q3EMD5_9LABR